MEVTTRLQAALTYLYMTNTFSQCHQKHSQRNTKLHVCIALASASNLNQGNPTPNPRKMAAANPAIDIDIADIIDITITDIAVTELLPLTILPQWHRMTHSENLFSTQWLTMKERRIGKEFTPSQYTPTNGNGYVPKATSYGR